MKIISIEKLTDLDKALAYIKELNPAYQVIIDEAKALDEKNKNLVKDLALSQSKRADADFKVVELTGKLEFHDTLVNELKSSTDRNALLEAAITVANETASNALSEVESLSTKLDLQEKHGGDGGTIVTIGRRSAKLIGDRFLTKEGEINAETASKDQKFLQRLVDKGSGAIVFLD